MSAPLHRRRDYSLLDLPRAVRIHVCRATYLRRIYVVGVEELEMNNQAELPNMPPRQRPVKIYLTLQENEVKALDRAIAESPFAGKYRVDTIRLLIENWVRSETIRRENRRSWSQTEIPDRHDLPELLSASGVDSGDDGYDLRVAI